MKRGDAVTKSWLTAKFLDIFKNANEVDETQIPVMTSLQVVRSYEDGGSTYYQEKMQTLNNQYFDGIYELGTTNLLYQALYDEVQKVV